ncbi:hypothetical protein NDU88_003180 [Pleurodeles waltl]|uniref:Uncharacterized protein n=1 Tax=Pleurodeles waltl TaxID=8319 RepID=A0AAV7MSP2_PLEWA|nr:hypothetical protein NDU88_003180 [Pleurodeles waltl]
MTAALCVPVRGPKNWSDQPNRSGHGGCVNYPCTHLCPLGLLRALHPGARGYDPPYSTLPKAGTQCARSASLRRGAAFARSLGPFSPCFRHQFLAYHTSA